MSHVPIRHVSMMTRSDRDIIELCFDGQPEEYRLLVRRYQSALLVYLKGLLGNACDAEEVAQESFVRAYFGLAKLENLDSFYPWLVGIARRVVQEDYRRKQRQSDLQGQLQLMNHKNPSAMGITDMELEQAMIQLPDDTQELIHRRFYANQSCSQIAELQNVPLNTVTKRLSRAYARLRKLLKASEVSS